MKLITVIVLTMNEEKHLPRLLDSLGTIDMDVCIVDAMSTDRTREIAQERGARVFQNRWINYAVQFQWAMDNCGITTPWIMRMDADEYLTPELASEMQQRLPDLDETISGIMIKRQVHFMGKWIRHGGYYPIKLLRIWRNGIGSIEQKWMDEHIVLSSGKTVEFKFDLIDDNLNTLSWWTEKHNHYATREAIDLLNKEFNLFMETEIKTGILSEDRNARKRWYKRNLYLRLPLFFRVFLYFHYRYFFRLGFLDGRKGLIWHFLQGFWYRFLVDAKIYQIKWLARKQGLNISEVLEKKYDFKIQL